MNRVSGAVEGTRRRALSKSATMSTVDAQDIAAVIHDRRRVRAVTLDETPGGITQMDTLADAPPIFHVISEFECCCVVVYAQHQTAIGTCYRLERLSLTHARRRPKKRRAKHQRKETVNRIQSRRRVSMLKPLILL
jgi:hypothetical protein